MRKNILIHILVIALVVAFQFSPMVNAQQAQQPAGTPVSEATRPVDNYLERFHALDRVEFLKTSNLDKIYMLKVIVTNFKDQGWEGEYRAIYDGYKKGMDFYYRREIVNARVELDKNRRDIFALFKKMADFYKQRTQALLSECAGKILDLDLDERSRANPDKNRVLFQNTARLRIAYGQYDDAQRMMDDHVYDIAVKHFRVAKTFAIAILESIDPEGSKGKFDLDKADNLNRILNPPQAQAR